MIDFSCRFTIYDDNLPRKKKSVQLIKFVVFLFSIKFTAKKLRLRFVDFVGWINVKGDSPEILVHTAMNRKSMRVKFGVICVDPGTTDLAALFVQGE